MNEKIDVDLIRSMLLTKTIGRQLLYFDDVESKNSRSKIRRGKQLGIPPDTQFKPV